ncbi:MAG: hypothetical protein IPI57_14515 [Candidatus Competibacteraceae bacterium]|nr:hypothetical protein [Candidatus Competibacteraceae bacterium]
MSFRIAINQSIVFRPTPDRRHHAPRKSRWSLADSALAILKPPPTAHLGKGRGRNRGGRGGRIPCIGDGGNIIVGAFEIEIDRWRPRRSPATPTLRLTSKRPAGTDPGAGSGSERHPGPGKHVIPDPNAPPADPTAPAVSETALIERLWNGYKTLH